VKHLVRTSGVEKHGRRHEDLTTMVEEPIGKQ